MKAPEVHVSVMCVHIITMHVHINICDRSINHARRAQAWLVCESKSMSRAPFDALIEIYSGDKHAYEQTTIMLSLAACARIHNGREEKLL